MKSKRFNKSLSLNKETVSNLEIIGMKDVLGGDLIFTNFCETWGNDSCDTVCFSYDPKIFCKDPSFCGCDY